jgi:glutathione peroxidase
MKSLIAVLLLLMTTTTADAAPIHGIPLVDIDGNRTSLKKYQGKVLLIVNVASKCGFTGQYEGLEAVYRKYAGKGLVVLGFPCNQFFGQEPGTEKEIAAFCQTAYGVTFPIFSKIDVKGVNQHPLFTYLTGEVSPKPGKVSWNFNKFLIGRDGILVDRFGSMTKPQGKTLVAAVEKALGL